MTGANVGLAGALKQAGERDGEVVGVDRVGCLDEGFDVVRDVPEANVHAGLDSLLVEPEGDELPGVGMATEDDLVVAGWADVAGVFHAEVVLVGEEVRRSCVDGIFSEHCLGGGGALSARIRPVLDTQMSTQPWVCPRASVSNGQLTAVADRASKTRLQPRLEPEPSRCCVVLDAR